VFDPFVRDGRVAQVEVFQLGQALQMGQPLVGHLGAEQVEPLQLGKVFQVGDARIRDGRAVQQQRLQGGQLLQMGQALVGKSSALEAQGLQFLQTGQMNEPRAGDAGANEGQFSQLGKPRQMFQLLVLHQPAKEDHSDNRLAGTALVALDACPDLAQRIQRLFFPGGLLFGFPRRLAVRRRQTNEEGEGCQAQSGRYGPAKMAFHDWLLFSAGW
jgi:hypothetical protein